jgi:hypothetical protein
MPSTDNPSGKYHVEVSQAQGVVIGEHANVEQHFYSTPASPPINRDDSLAAIREANAELRAYPDKIAGIHLGRAEVIEILAWIHNPNPKEPLGMVLDQPGSGKTVVMRDVLVRLENESVPVLAIKADFLSGLKTSDDLAGRLGLPVTVEECARQLATEGLFVVLLDQLDALSLSLSRDQATLDVMLSTLARLRNLDNVRILASCRTFDLNNDPRLSQVTVDHRFQLQPLTEEQIDRVLQAIGVDSSRLLPAHRELLAIPLHLDVYARVTQAGNVVHPAESYHTLQELYEALWQKRIAVMPPDLPVPAERIAAIYRLVEVMQNGRQIAAPIAVLDDHPEAAAYLERVDFIRREGRNWAFFHETLFDYCYSRRFVAQGRSLNQELLDGPQGLFERSQMVQVLAYLRGANEAVYHRELKALLFSDKLRTHLRLLLIGWFGSLPDPSTAELGIARQFIQDDENRARFFRAIGGNVGWFDRLKESMIPRMLRSSDEQEINLAVGFLSTLMERNTDSALAYLEPYLGVSEAWDERISFCLANIESWRSNEAVEMVCDLFLRCRTFNRESSYLYSLRSNPAAGCRVLRIYLDQRLDELLEHEAAGRELERVLQHGRKVEISDRFTWEQYLLGEYAMGQLIERANQECPSQIIEHIFPWFTRAAVVLSKPSCNESPEGYPFDPLFSAYWYGEHLSEGAAYAVHLSKAIQSIAQLDPAQFRATASVLVNVESLAVHRVLAHGFLADAKEYADDIFDYMKGDSRRFNLGEYMDSPHYDSQRLIVAAFQHLNAEDRFALEQLILGLKPAWETRARGRYGITQLHFLKGIPVNLLSETARQRRQELEHKFPNFELRVPQGIDFKRVPPPIEQEAQAKMSDEAWLGSMRKYDDSTARDALRKDPLKGGVTEHSRAFAEQVKADPERFYNLAQHFDETISLYYVGAAISGAAESTAPSEKVFELVRRFANRIEGEARRGVCLALTKRAEDGVPDELLDIMSDWALHDPSPEKKMWLVQADSGQSDHQGDPFQHGINTNRGAAIRAVCHCALKHNPPQFERVFQLLARAANDPSTAVRTCIIEVLGPLFNRDAGRTLAIFECTMEGHPALLQSPLVHRFLYWVYRKHFDRIRPFVEALVTHTDDSTRQAGAQLACLAAFHYPAAGELAKQALTGDAALRRGAAQVYARNLEYEDVKEVCRERLFPLMHDPDEEVRRHVGQCFMHLQPEHLDELRPFIEAFLNSPALLTGARHLIDYLKPLAADEQELALQVTDRILDRVGNKIVDIHTSVAMLENDLVRLPLAVYTHAPDLETQSQAMALFEQLLLLNSRAAKQALADWDRR